MIGMMARLSKMTRKPASLLINDSSRQHLHMSELKKQDLLRIEPAPYQLSHQKYCGDRQGDRFDRSLIEIAHR